MFLWTNGAVWGTFVWSAHVRVRCVLCGVYVWFVLVRVCVFYMSGACGLF